MPSALIEHIKKYVALTDAESGLILSELKPVQVSKKTFLLQQGQVCKHTYFVEKGCLRLFFINDKGTEQITQFAIENWWLADYMSFERQTPSHFYIQALEPSEVICLENTLQEKLLQQVPQLERYFRLVMQRAYAATQLRFKYLYDFSKEESYQHFTSLYPGFVQRIPQYMLASYLGFTPEYLSELRKKKR